MNVRQVHASVIRKPGPGGALWLVVAGMLAVAACAPSRAPEPAPGVRIASADRQAVEAHVEGRRIRIEAPEKSCVFPGSVGVTDGAAHVVIGDCVWHHPRAGAPVLTGISGEHGVLSVSLLGADFPKRGWEDFEGFLRSPEGAAALDVPEITAVIRDDLGIFVVTPDQTGAHEVICRAYTELNGRLAVVALLDMPAGEDVPAMRARLSAVIADLQALNRRARWSG